MNASVIEDAAQASDLAYHRGRLPLPWRILKPHEQHRWNVLAAKWLNGEILSPQECREVYFDGYAPWSWPDVAPAYKARWTAVRAALAAFRVEVAA